MLRSHFFEKRHFFKVVVLGINRLQVVKSIEDLAVEPDPPEPEDLDLTPGRDGLLRPLAARWVQSWLVFLSAVFMGWVFRCFSAGSRPKGSLAERRRRYVYILIAH